MMNRNFAMAALAAATFTAAPASATVNLVTNGGFEMTSHSGNFEFGSAPGAVGSVTAWNSAASGYNLLFHSDIANSSNAAGTYQASGKEYMWASTASPSSPTTPSNFVALDGDPTVRGALTQTINGLTVGNVYNVTFDWAGGQLRSRTGATTEQLQVSFGGQTFSTSVLNTPSQGFTGWYSTGFAFTATNTSQLLSFLSIGTPTGLPPVALLDNVAVQAVPEPATWAMMLLGFGVVGAASRYRRRGVLPAAA